MKLNGKKIIVFVANDYEDLEAWYPILRLKEAGAEVTVVASDNVEGMNCKSKHGYEIAVEEKAANIETKNFDGAVIPGGWAPDTLRQCKNTLRIVKELMENEKLVASICHGGWVLASADVIKYKKLTSTSAIKDDMKHAGADWVDEEVVVDDNLITSRKPADLPAFMTEIIKALS